MSATHQQRLGQRLTTAEITYHLPDHPTLLQTYVWQGYDLAPSYPKLHKFLDFWARNLDGALHSVRVANVPVWTAPKVGHADSLLTLH